jgi:ubiquitin carboxyl-terminal hydrolase 5/13
MEGGFSAQEPEYDETFEIVILPEFIFIPFPSVDLPEKVPSIVYANIEVVI